MQANLKPHQRAHGGPILVQVKYARGRVLDKVTASVEKQFGPSAVYGKSNRATDLLCKHLLALVHSVVEEGEVLGIGFAGDLLEFLHWPMGFIPRRLCCFEWGHAASSGSSGASSVI